LTSGHSDAQPRASECPDVKNYKLQMTAQPNPVWHKMYGNTGRQRVNRTIEWWSMQLFNGTDSD